MQVELGLFRELKSELSCPVDTDTAHVALLSAVIEIKYSAVLQTWALIPHITFCPFLLFFKPLTSKVMGVFLIHDTFLAFLFLTNNTFFGSLDLIKH